MNLFSISQLEQFSGIKAHTIRIWEKRYDALKPNRSEGNTRYYDNTQLKRLLNIVSLMDAGHKVSKLCSFSDEKLFEVLNEKLNSSFSDNETTEYYISQLVAAGMTYDETHFDATFTNCLNKYGMKDTYLKVIYPLLFRIGLMWANDSMAAANDHFISNIIKQKLFSTINALPVAKNHSDTWLLFLPENEFHELSLLFSNYLIKKAGKKVFYLGANVPIDMLKVSVNQIAPTNLLFFLVHHDLVDDSQNYLNTLTENFKNSNIHLSGNEKLISQLKTGEKIEWIRSVQELEDLLK